MRLARRILMSGRRPEILRRLQRRPAAGVVDAEEADAAVVAEALERVVQMPAAKVEDLADAEAERGRRREL